MSKATVPTRRRKPGGASKKTAEALQTIEDNLKKGVSLRGAAAAAGISEVTLHDWKRTDSQFAKMVERACAESEATLVNLAVDGAKKDGRVALMMLERRFPDNWSRIDRVDIKGSSQNAHLVLTAEDAKLIRQEAHQQFGRQDSPGRRHRNLIKAP